MKYPLWTGALLAAIAFAIGAEAQQVKPETQIKLRKSAYALMNFNFDAIDQMLEGKRAFNKDEAIRRADAVAVLATQPKEFFGPGTDSAAGETRAKPEIWTKRADFDAKMDKLVQETSKLPQAARADRAALKKQMNDVEAACKACHDDYRVKKN